MDASGLSFMKGIGQGESLVSKIAEYVKIYNPKLYVLTPCYGGMCHVNYMTCMLATVEMFQLFHVPLRFEFCKNDSLVPRARNNLVAKAMNDTDTTHMIFIDSDITWNPIDLLKLMISDKPLIGGIYPLKQYHWNQLTSDGAVASTLAKRQTSQLDQHIDEVQMIQATLLKYNVNYLPEGKLLIENNIAKVRHIPTGFMMIQRTVIQKMMAEYPTTKYADDVGYLSAAENQYAYALFDCQVMDGHYLSEDWLFCERWNHTGGHVYIDVSVPLTHSGIEDYRGNYLASIV